MTHSLATLAILMCTVAQASPNEILADPSVYVAPDGQVEVYGTGTARRYNSTDDFEKNRNAKDIIKEVHLVNPNGSPINNVGVWDLMKFSWPTGNGHTVDVYTGAMSVSKDGQQEGRWPDDNISRRSYQFLPDGHGHLVRSTAPLFGQPDHNNWIGHTYGRSPLLDAENHVVVGSDGKGILYYEKIGRVIPGSPEKTITEIYARPFEVVIDHGKPVMKVSASESKVLGIQLPPKTSTRPAKPSEDTSRTGWISSRDPAVRRKDGGLLIEGPRVNQVTVNGRTFYVMGFSAGEFNSDKYGIYFAVSQSPFGPFKSIKDPNGQLKDFSEGLKKKRNLSWVGRPFLWRDSNGQYQMTFHGQDKNLDPNKDARQPMTVPVSIETDPRYGVTVKLLDDPTNSGTSRGVHGSGNARSTR